MPPDCMPPYPLMNILEILLEHTYVTAITLSILSPERETSNIPDKDKNSETHASHNTRHTPGRTQELQYCTRNKRNSIRLFMITFTQIVIMLLDTHLLLRDEKCARLFVPLAQTPVATAASSSSRSPVHPRRTTASSASPGGCGGSSSRADGRLDNARGSSHGGDGLLISPREGRAALAPLPCAVVEAAAFVGPLTETRFRSSQVKPQRRARRRRAIFVQRSVGVDISVHRLVTYVPWVVFVTLLRLLSLAVIL